MGPAEPLNLEFLDQFIVNGKWTFYPIGYDPSRKFVIGYDLKTKKAVYRYKLNGVMLHFDLISECIDDYADWAIHILEHLHYDIEIFDSKNEYYERLIKKTS